jgi:hypothetical protein
MITLVIIFFYTYKMWYDHKRIWISMKSNITIAERISAHKNPVFLTPQSIFHNPYDRGLKKNILEFLIPCPLFCCLPKGDNSNFGELIRDEFIDGIKNSVLTHPKNIKRDQNRATEASYEEIPRNSTVGASS